MAELAAMPKYETYKYSGIDWIGEIPNEWNLVPGFRAYSQNKRNNKGLKEGRVLSLSYGNIIVKPKEKLVGLVPESFETYQIVEPGDLIIRCMDLQNDKTSLRTGLAKDHGIITSAYLNLKINDNFDSKFLYYYLHSLDTTKVLYKFGTGLRQNLSFQDFNRLPVFDIPKSLQTAIVNFLDKKTGQIDEAIAIKEKQIGLLKERKQLIIQKAVTQGLNPEAPMKDSDVEWIGQTPEHWGVSKLRYLGVTQNGISAGAEYFGSGHPFVSYGDVYKNRELPLKVKGLAKSSIRDRKQYSIIENDVLFTRTSETAEEIGFASICMKTIDEATFAGFLIRFRPSNKLFKGYSKYYFNSAMMREYFVKEMNLVIRASLSQELLKNLPVLLPSLDEQEFIYNYLECETGKIEDAIDLQVQQIKKLKEYKTTLINSAVTGKIKVS
jgi:type I restriction enzyme S subunit|tara:strand:- start:53056 stop:54369 length:1314 start_codon:yes stop_codon:yes gene_type:complete